MLYELFAEIDQLTPKQRLKVLAKEDEPIYAEKILLCMYSINECLQKLYSTQYFYYVMDDASVFYVLRQSMSEAMGKKDFLTALNLLDISKFLYRFPCAKKFQIEDPSIYQLRINSWGREECKNTLLQKYCLEHKRLLVAIEAYFKNNNIVYKELTERLLQPIDPENAKCIKVLNKNLDIKILS